MTLRLSLATLTAPRTTLRVVGSAGLAIGTAMVVAPRLCMRAIGLGAEPRSTAFLGALYGGRDLALGAALLTVAARDDIDPIWLDVVVATQISDIALTWRLWHRRQLSNRALITVMASAPPTAVLSLLGRRRLGSERP